MRKHKMIRRFAVTLSLCIGMMAQPLAASAMTPLQIRQCDAEILLEAEDYAGAEAALTPILQQLPDDITAWMDRAKARAEQGRFEEAFQDYRQAIRLMQAASGEDWDSTLTKAIEESAGYANAKQQYRLWLNYFDDVTITAPAGGVSYSADTLQRNKELFRQFDAIYGQMYSQLPPQLAASAMQMQFAEIAQDQKQQAEASRQAAQQREQLRQAALAGLDQSYYSEQDATTVRYGGTGIQLTDSTEQTQLFILSQPMQSAQCSGHGIVCYVPAGTDVYTCVTGVGAKGWGYAYFGQKYTVGAGQTVKILDDSGTTDVYYNLTVIGV